jgi:hypothetical protein
MIDGHDGCGKTTVVDHLTERMGFSAVPRLRYLTDLFPSDEKEIRTWLRTADYREICVAHFSALKAAMKIVNEDSEKRFVFDRGILTLEAGLCAIVQLRTGAATSSAREELRSIAEGTLTLTAQRSMSVLLDSNLSGEALREFVEQRKGSELDPQYASYMCTFVVNIRAFSLEHENVIRVNAAERLPVVIENIRGHLLKYNNAHHA